MFCSFNFKFSGRKHLVWLAAVSLVAASAERESPAKSTGVPLSSAIGS